MWKFTHKKNLINISLEERKRAMKANMCGANPLQVWNLDHQKTRKDEVRSPRKCSTTEEYHEKIGETELQIKVLRMVQINRSLLRKI